MHRNHWLHPHAEFIPRARGQVQVYGVIAKTFYVGCSIAGEKDVEKHEKHDWFWIPATLGPITCAGQLRGASIPSWPRRSAVTLSASLVHPEFQSPASCLSQLVLKLTPIPPFPVLSRAAAGEGKLLWQPHLSLHSSRGHLPNTAPSWSRFSYSSLKKANTVIC